MIYQKILQFYQNLEFKESLLNKETRVMNPYTEDNPEVQRLLQEFYTKYYSDTNNRTLILGINPGRLGAGLTGIPFTDSPALKNYCDINTSIATSETSAAFVYEFIKSFGGPEEFYAQYFIGAACPLGFTHLNDKGNWVNWNYYDSQELFQAVKPFMVKHLKNQIEICGSNERAIVWGNGKNFKFLSAINKEEKLFKAIVPLEHPRYIMQYKRKSLPIYIDKYLEVFHQK
ncbi:MAG: hypothetical protein ACJAZH_001575 [Roseivirga sp.]|jgi:hypothetical protein